MEVDDDVFLVAFGFDLIEDGFEARETTDAFKNDGLIWVGRLGAFAINPKVGGVVQEIASANDVGNLFAKGGGFLGDLAKDGADGEEVGVEMGGDAGGLGGFAGAGRTIKNDISGEMWGRGGIHKKENLKFD